jgi:hypothetical protein
MKPPRKVVAIVITNFEGDGGHVLLVAPQHGRGAGQSQRPQIGNRRGARGGLKGADKVPFGHMSQTRQLIEVDGLMEVRLEVPNRVANAELCSRVGALRPAVGTR